MDSCPSCKANDYILSGDTKVKNGQIISESACLGCVLTFREIVRPKKPDDQTRSSVNLVRATFTNRGKLNKAQILALKQKDRKLYASWLTVVEHLRKTLVDQFDSDDYSEYACHLLYTLRIILTFVARNLENRICQIDAWLRSQEEP